MKYLIIFLSFLFLGCETNIPKKSSGISITGHEFTIYTINKCEYLGYGIGTSGGVLTHKGDCSNPIHKCLCK